MITDNQDEIYLNELHSYTSTFQKPSIQQLKKYDEKMKFMESIHDEIRLKHIDFMPIYDVFTDMEFAVGKKYLEVEYNYNIPQTNNHLNSH